TVADLARVVTPAPGPEPAAGREPPREAVRSRALTPEQEGVYFHWRLEPNSPYYSYQGSLRSAGPVDWERLATAWSVLLAENPNLLAAVDDTDAGPVQRYPAWSV